MRRFQRLNWIRGPTAHTPRPLALFCSLLVFLFARNVLSRRVQVFLRLVDYQTDIYQRFWTVVNHVHVFPCETRRQQIVVRVEVLIDVLRVVQAPSRNSHFACSRSARSFSLTISSFSK